MIRKPLFILLVSIFTILIIVALVLTCTLNIVIHHFIEEQAQLNPGSPLFQQWSEPSVPIYLQFYFFNLTNPADFRLGAKPIVKQCGPYTYHERRFKRQIEINETASTISYSEEKQYFFVRAMSVGPESDVISSINLVYLTIAYQVSWLPKVFISILEMAEELFSDELITRRNVSDWLWGYEDPFLSYIKQFLPLNISVIGLYSNKNNTLDGPYVIDSGVSDRTKLGHILKYQGHSSMSCWTTSLANRINGSDGSLFHSFLGQDEDIFVFAADICRSLEFSPREWSEIHGIRTRKYLPLEDLFDSPKLNQKNRGFCPRWPTCFETGVLDMSSCQPGVPIAMSMPHFVHANRTYQDGVIGLHPSAEFNTTFHIEPRTGLVLSATKKLQVNANITNNPKFRSLATVSSVLLPIMFVNESVTVDSGHAKWLRQSIDVIPLVALVGTSLLLATAFMVILILTLVFMRQRREPDSEPLLTIDSDVIA
ncbi:hypothetical protein CRM22_008371 [Opisthorchis felineus]|uniref:Scavenger receptor class B member 1 n=1 Tax=Opisthorchis felineus TaxID=147828 RepID=A0A4S2LJE6_OPIFE|nr:hypothetical protein CRM22_008371 [Opisthorchis felineus]